jgi:hypothetical protein
VQTEIVVALIATAGTIGGVLVTSYFVSRQAVRDLRLNVTREIDIVRRLRTGSDEAVMLEQHISKNIRTLIDRDARRERNSREAYLFGSLLVLTFGLIGLGRWRESGVPELIRWPVEFVYWSLWVFYGLILMTVVLNFLCLAFTVIKTGVRFGRVGIKLSVLWGRLVRHRILIKMKGRQLKRLTARVSAAAREVEVRQAYNEYLQRWTEEHRDEIVASVGQDKYDARLADIVKHRAHGEAILRGELLPNRSEDQPYP